MTRTYGLLENAMEFAQDLANSNATTAWVSRDGSRGYLVTLTPPLVAYRKVEPDHNVRRTAECWTCGYTVPEWQLSNPYGCASCDHVAGEQFDDDWLENPPL